MFRDGFMQAKFKKIFFLAILFSVLISNTGCTYKSYKDMKVGAEVPMGMDSFESSQAMKPFDRFPQYRIVPGDVLDVLYQIRSWIKRDTFHIEIDHTITVKFSQSPELTETQKVRPDGKISLPYLGDALVVGKTPDELKTTLIEFYSKIFQEPEITVLIPEFRGRLIDFKKDLHTSPRGLSRLVTVRPDGYVTFPLIGDLLVAGQTIPEVKQVMNERYSELMPDLYSDLFLEKHAGSVIYVAGQIRAPGSYRIDRPVTILEALTLAGGHVYGAKLDSIIVVRKTKQVLVARKVDLSKTLDFTNKDSFFYLQPNDIVFVPTTRIYTAAKLSRSIADILQFRGWGSNFVFRLNKTESSNVSSFITAP